MPALLPPTGPPAGFSLLVRRSVGRTGARAVVALRGDVDLAAVPALTRLRGALHADPGRPPLGAPGGQRPALLAVVVVCSRVRFMDATGLGAVLALGPPGRPVQLRAVTPAVELVLTAVAAEVPIGTLVVGGERRSPAGARR